MEGGYKKTINMGNCLKRGLDNLQEAWQKNKAEGVYEGEGERVDTSMRTMT